MKEHRIHFRPESVRAILAGTKTMTRRVLKTQPPEGMSQEAIRVERFEPLRVDRYGEEYPGPEIFGAYDTYGEWGCRCPYGAPGDALWVREAWCQKASNLTGELIYNKDGDIDPSCCHYRADGNNVVHHEDPNRSPWRPSIHMPRRCSRLTLRVEDVRVERVQEITPDDIEAEGVPVKAVPYGEVQAAARFRQLWNQINGKRHPWESNPWVWKIAFSVLEVKP